MATYTYMYEAYPADMPTWQLHLQRVLSHTGDKKIEIWGT